MQEQIIEKLKDIERTNTIKILYACESGSRAWGFPSLDSDYDVRFFYMHSVDGYLSIEDKKDSITDVGKVLDFSGWELRKTLKLFRGTNSGLYEKLQSPVVYMEEDGFAAALKSYTELYYCPLAGIHHYLSHVRSFMENDFTGKDIKLKKYFYTIRMVLAADWIYRYQHVPPMQLKDLRSLIADAEIQHWIDKMLAYKAGCSEDIHVPRFDLLDEFLKSKSEEVAVFVQSYPGSKKESPDVLNRFFRQWISKR